MANERLPVVIDHPPVGEEEVEDAEDAIDLDDPRWGGGASSEPSVEDPPEMDEGWCRRRLWEITKALRAEVQKGQAANSVVVMAMREEAGIVKTLLAKAAPVGKRTDEIPDADLDAQIEQLRKAGKL